MINVRTIPKIRQMWRNDFTYCVLFGGRASGKTIGIADYLIFEAMSGKKNILCTREYQSSIRDSTYAVLKRRIIEHGLEESFIVKHDGIECVNGSLFVFKGLRRDIYSIKSMDKVDICFIEEADTIRDSDWTVLLPTILRNAGCQIIVAFNPVNEFGDTYTRFVTGELKNALKIEINYPDNPFLSQEILDEIEILRVKDYSKYEHIYLGKPLTMTADVIFKGRFKVADIELQEINGRLWHDNKMMIPRFGMDFGFSVDPTAMIEAVMLDKNTLYIYNEIYETQLLPDAYVEKIKANMPHGIGNGSKWFCDNSRPDTIAQLKKWGLNAVGAEKGKGSVEAGIDYLLGLNIIIHPDCKNVIYEFYNYRYKKDKEGNILREIIDANNHAMDAIRYMMSEDISTSGRKQIKRIAKYG